MLKTNAGYTIIKQVTVSDQVSFVLGEMERENNKNLFVTWEYNQMGSYFWGHYFDDYFDAMSDLYKRVSNEARFLANHYKEMALPY